MALSLSATIAYSFLTSAIVGLFLSLFTDRISVKMALLIAVCTTAGTVVGRIPEPAAAPLHYNDTTAGTVVGRIL